MYQRFTTQTYRYPQNAEDPEVIACFDTDKTVDIGPGGQPGPVPFGHIIELKQADDVSVWATGFNQSLRSRAGIPGMRELKELADSNESFVERDDRMRLIDEVFPDADEKYVVDDVDLSVLEPEWDYYIPEVYARDELGIEVTNIPDPTPLVRREDRRQRWATGDIVSLEDIDDSPEPMQSELNDDLSLRERFVRDLKQTKVGEWL